MQNALPDSTRPRHPQIPTNHNAVKTRKANGDLKSMVKDNAVIVFAKRGCCMNHVVKRLLQGLGANPAVYEVDDKDVNHVLHELELTAHGGDTAVGRLLFPAVFIGGPWFGGLDRVIATHITEELGPLLKQAGALWL